MDIPTQRRWFYKLLQALVKGIIRLFGSLHVEGVENFPAQGPYIIAINHLHWMDIPVLFVILPHEVATFAAEKWEHHPLVGPLLRTIGHAIFVQRGEPDRRAITRAIQWLKQGGVLGIAPEGTRSRSGTLQKGKPGTVYLATRSGAPIIPVAMWGHEVFWKEVRRLRRPRIHIRVGSPIYLDTASKRPKGAELEAHAEKIMLAIACMLPESYRGVYRSQCAQLEVSQTPSSNTGEEQAFREARPRGE